MNQLIADTETLFPDFYCNETFKKNIISLYNRVAVFFMSDETFDLKSVPRELDQILKSAFVLVHYSRELLSYDLLYSQVVDILDILLHNMHDRARPVRDIQYFANLVKAYAYNVESERYVLESTSFFTVQNVPTDLEPRVIDMFLENDILLSRLYSSEKTTAFRNLFVKKSHSMLFKLKKLEDVQTGEFARAMTRHRRNHLFMIYTYFLAKVYKDIVDFEGTKGSMSLYRNWKRYFLGTTSADIRGRSLVDDAAIISFECYSNLFT